MLVSIRSQANWVDVAPCICTFRGSMIPFLTFFFFFTAFCILSLVEWPAPHGLFLMGPCIVP